MCSMLVFPERCFAASVGQGKHAGGGRLARECLEAANSGQNEDGRNALLQMAQVWLRLAAEPAEDLGQATATPPGSAEEPRPVVQQQQQQQVQPKTDDHKG